MRVFIKTILKEKYKKYVSPLTLKMPYFGHWLYFPKGSAIVKTARLNGDFEPEIRKLMLQLTKENSTVFDVGTNIGWLSIPILQTHPSVKVVSFEPSPSVLPYLRQTNAQSPHKSRWKIIEKAVGSEVKMTFFAQHGVGGDAYDGVISTGRAGKSESIEVPITTLDAEWQALGNPSVSLIKIDVEGFEMPVLVGAEKCINQCRPAIITEWCEENLMTYDQPNHAIFTWAERMKYDIYVIPNLQPIRFKQDLEVALLSFENFLLMPQK